MRSHWSVSIATKRGREDTVLLLEDVFTQHIQHTQEPGWPGRVIGEAVRSLTQHLLDLAMLGAQRRDVIGELTGAIS